MGLQSGSPEQHGTQLPWHRIPSSAVLNHAPAAIYAVDHAGRCTQVNAAALALMGYSETECLGRDMHSLIHATREDGSPYPPEQCPVYEARVTGKPVYNSEEVLWTKDGVATHVKCSAVPLPAAGDGTGAVVTILDEPFPAKASGTKDTAATELQEAKTLVERRLAESEKLFTMGRLAASIAHEINNPLEALTNLLYLACQDATLSTEAKEYLNQAEGELRRVTEIVSQTLRFHRGKAQPVECKPESLIDSVLALHRGKLHIAGIRIDRQHRRSRAFLCREGDVRQILNNLLSNAIDATRGTGGHITIRTAPAHDAQSGQEGIRISVSDTGHGMSQDTAAQIFNPFYTTKGSGGSGLGLWISHSIAQRHGGKLRVRSSTSRHKRGTTFSLFIPHPASSANAA